MNGTPLLVMFLVLNSGTITWSSKKQTCIALSTMEAELIACFTAVHKVVWLKRFMEHLGITGRPMDVV